MFFELKNGFKTMRVKVILSVIFEKTPDKVHPAFAIQGKYCILQILKSGPPAEPVVCTSPIRACYRHAP